MRLFNAGALRPATDAARLSAANDLVRRTLAQNGILSPQINSGLGAATAVLPLDQMLQRLAPLGAAKPVATIDLPDGADFRLETFSCAAGSRRFKTYVPASAAECASGVVVMLHGCTQTPDDFATGTGMNALAEQHGFIVVYPEQSRGQNAQSCWNWFSRGDQRRGRGEPAILAGLTTQVCAEFGIGRERTFVSGLSAGAAMAAILGETYGDVFAAVGAHSGLPTGSAKDVTSAFAAMAGNALVAPAPVAGDHMVRTIVFHGTSDTTVFPSNGDSLARRARQINALQSIERQKTGEAAGRRYSQEISSNADGDSVVEHWMIDGQGHAWSGGHKNGSYTDPHGPNASAEMIRFFFETPNRDA